MVSGRLILCLMLVALFGGCEDRPQRSAPPQRKVLVVWYPWGGELARALREIVNEFERSHPGIEVKLTYAANNLTSSQKLFLAIAGGKPPDVTFVDGQQLSEWAARGALSDITGRVRGAGLSEADFFTPRWQESTFAGRVYALPWGADPNFALLWNRQLFREAGLDPDRPPRTIAELDTWNERLTKVDRSGRITQIGIVPWQWGGDNSMFTWGYAFGGQFYQPPPDESASAVGRITANHPANVEALRWMASYARRYDVRRVAAMNADIVGETNQPFFLGRVAMSLVHVTQLPYLRKYAPHLDYGIGFIPAPETGEYPSAWMGGWSLAIPRGADDSDEAFAFIRWMCASPEGTAAMGRTMNQFPAYKASPYFATIEDHPDLSVYYQLALRARHARTRAPVQGYVMELLRRAVDEVLYGHRDPQAALDEVSRKAQHRLEEIARARARAASSPAPAGAQRP